MGLDAVDRGYEDADGDGDAIDVDQSGTGSVLVILSEMWIKRLDVPRGVSGVWRIAKRNQFRVVICVC